VFEIATLSLAMTKVEMLNQVDFALLRFRFATKHDKKKISPSPYPFPSRARFFSVLISVHPAPFYELFKFLINIILNIVFSWKKVRGKSVGKSFFQYLRCVSVFNYSLISPAHARIAGHVCGLCG